MASNKFLTDITVDGNVNLNTTSGEYKINNTTLLNVSATYTRLYNPEGAIGLYIGDSADRTNYYDNNQHRFRGAGGSGDKMFINSSGNVGIGTTSPAGKLHVDGGRSYFTPSGDSNSGTNSHVIDIYNANDTAFTADARTAYNAHTSWDINSRSTYTISSRAKSGSIYTFAGEHASSPVAINRYVQLNSNNDNPILNWTFYQWDGAGTAASDLKVPNKVWTIQSYQSGGSDTLLVLNGDGTLQLNQYGAGILKTDSSGNVSVDTNTYITASGAVDTDASAEIGKAHIGAMGHADYAGFSHIDQNSTVSYALLQSATGTTFLNSASGKPIYFRINNSSKMVLASSGNLGIGTTSPSQLLHLSKSGSNPYIRISSDSFTGLDIGQETSAGNGIINLRDDKDIRILTNGADVVRIKNNGNVGIGTTGPAAKLQVYGNTNGSVITKVTNDSDGTSAYSETHWESGSSGNELRIGVSHNYASSQWNNAWVYAINKDLALKAGSTGKSIKFYTNGSDESDVKAIIDSSGNVGIGTTSPSAALHINKSGVPQLLLDGGGNTTGDIVVPTGEILQIGHWAPSTSTYTDRFRIAADGNVGIGTTSPGYKLDVSGSFNAQGVTNLGSAGNDVNIGNASSGYMAFKRTGHNYIAADQSNGTLIFRTGGTNNRMIINQSGNVGIGTTSPNQKLHLYGGNISIDNSGDVALIFAKSGASKYEWYLDNAANNFGLYDRGNSAWRFNVTNSGNVGIGTTSPSTKLHVQGDGSIIRLQNNNSDTNGTFIDFRDSTGTRTGYVGTTGTSDDMFLFTQGSKPIRFYTNASERMRITSSGYTQIKAVSGDSRLYLEGTTGTHFLTGTSGGAFGIYNDTASSYRMFIKSDGNIGIGTTSPTEKLSIYTATGRNFKVNQSTANVTILENDYELELRSGGGYDLKLNANGSSTYGNVTFRTNGSERMRVTSAGNVGIGTTSPSAPLDVRASSYKVVRLGNDITSHYTFSGNSDHTLTLTCGSYYQAEVVITANQTNSGGYNNWYVRGLWSNNHTTHHWDILEEVGYLTGSDFSFTNGQNDVENSGKLVISHTYNSGSFGGMTVRVTDMYGTHSYSIS